MKFSNPIGKTGLVEDIDFLCHTDRTSYSYIDKARNMNTWYRKVVSWIREAPSDWQYDDSNLTTLPVYTADLVVNQQDYELDSVAQAIERVEVLDADGNYQKLIPMDEPDIRNEAMSEFNETPGMPIYYDLKGRSVILYPKPGAGYVTTTAGLKIYVKRDVDSFVAKEGTADGTVADHLQDDTNSQFEATDVGKYIWNTTDDTFAIITTYNDAGDVTLDTDIMEDTEEYILYDVKEPGFISNFHRILPLGASFDYEEDPTKKNYLKAQINELHNELTKFYSSRHKEYIKRITPHKQNYE